MTVGAERRNNRQRKPLPTEPAGQLIKYLETLFKPDEYVSYVTGSEEIAGRRLPSKGRWDRTAGQLLKQLYECGGDIEAVIGAANPRAGAWIRYNPFDGGGYKDENITEFRYALVESAAEYTGARETSPPDSAALRTQRAMIESLKLPVACLVYGGGNSLHAIVRIDATNLAEYRERVGYLYRVCRRRGLPADTLNRRPSRLSRMPGIMRNGRMQALISSGSGARNWREWAAFS